MLDSDLAALYQVETRVFNQAVKRNEARFPERFRFQLSEKEYENLKSQFVTSSSGHGGRRHLPYVFTEQGVSMLSAVLRSDTAIEVSIKIIDAFVQMRHFLANNASLFQKIEQIEKKQLAFELKTDKKFEEVFEAIESREIKPKQGIFFDGQIFDAYLFVTDLIKSAKYSIILIDNYIDESVLTLFSKNQNVDVTIYTKSIPQQLKLDLKKYNAQYRPVTVKVFKEAHDRFMIIDGNELYHIGASLKDLGKKWFAFSRMDMGSFEILGRLSDG